MFNRVDQGTTAFSVAKHDPTVPLKGGEPILTKDTPTEFNVTELSNGFTIVTESTSFPSVVNLGFLIDVGSRDETIETSGSLLALRNTYLKTLKHTNETINYGMTQMSGGFMNMDYDQERIYYKA